MALTFLKPGASLAPYIDRYWIYDSGSDPSSFRPLVTPGVGLDVFIHYATPFAPVGGQPFPTSHIIFSGQNPTALWSSEQVHFLAIRFRAGALKNFTSIPLRELLDNYTDAESIWGNAGKDLIKRIRSNPSTPATIRQLEGFLQQQLARHRKDLPGWNAVVEELYRHHETHRIGGLARQLNLSIRHLRRRFIDETGFSPKHFQQLARFHATIKPLLLGQETNYLSGALDNGYFDQMHFIKEFRSFTHATPGRFLQKKAAMSHFYYPSLQR